jgi:hypothetical protein
MLARAGTGVELLPVLVTLDNRVLVDSSNAEIAAALGVRSVPPQATYDVVIVGGGPAGVGGGLRRFGGPAHRSAGTRGR